MSVESDAGAATGKATYDSANAYYMYAYRGLMLQAREEINTLRTHAAIGYASITEATWISNVKAEIDTESGLYP